MWRKVQYKLNSGKNSKFKYYLLGYLRELRPSGWLRKRLPALLREIDRRPDKDYILQRRDYYCALQQPTLLAPNAPQLKDWHIPKKLKVYYFDTVQYIRYFNQNLRWQCLPGDIVTVAETPSITKSRPLVAHNENNILFKMDKVRHFIFLNDTIPFRSKQDKAIFRGKVASKESRIQFMRMYFGSEVCDCGDVSKNSTLPKQWQVEKRTLREHLNYRYILCLEGNDVASNLKWVMSSNSIAVMPRPTCETWFMEGKLIPNYHYIEIKPDFTDLADRMKYYSTHLEEAEAIIQHAHEWVAQFRDPHREDLISLAVLDKYLTLVNYE